MLHFRESMHVHLQRGAEQCRGPIIQSFWGKHSRVGAGFLSQWVIDGERKTWAGRKNDGQMERRARQEVRRGELSVQVEWTERKTCERKWDKNEERLRETEAEREWGNNGKARKEWQAKHGTAVCMAPHCEGDEVILITFQCHCLSWSWAACSDHPPLIIGPLWGPLPAVRS